MHAVLGKGKVRATMLCLAAAGSLAACDKPPKPPRDGPPPRARIEASIELPGGNIAHILVVPTGYMESSRCVVVTSSFGPAVSCTPKDLDMPREGE